MKKWKILAGLGMSYVAYLMGGAMYNAGYHMLRYNKNTARAEQKADTNRNGVLETDEVLAVYESIGLNGAEVFQRLFDFEDAYHLVVRSWRTEEDKRKYLETILDIVRPEKNEQRTYPSRIILWDLASALADKDNDGKISHREAADAFRLAHETNHPKLKLLHEQWTPWVLLYPPAVLKDAELERYLR